MFIIVHRCRFLFQLHGLEGCGNRQPDLARFGNFCNFSRLKLVNLLSRLGDRFLRIAWYDMVCTCMILYDTNLLSCTSPAPLLHLSWPLLHPSCTSPDPCCASLPCTSPAEVRRLSGRHFKPFQNKCEAMQSFFVLLYRAIRCDYMLGLHGTSPDLSCTSPAPLLTSPAPLLHLSWPLLRLSSLHLSSRS